MKNQSFEFNEHELSGARLVVPFTILKRLGPKHHAIIIGTDNNDQLWIAELSRRHGYRLVKLSIWIQDNKSFVDGVTIEHNPGPKSNWDVAQHAIEEVQLSQSTDRKYDVVFNNCETFVDRHQGKPRTLSPQVRKSLKLLGFALAGGVYVLKSRLIRRTS